MSAEAVLTAVQNNGLVRVLAKSNHLVIAGLQIVHVFGFLLLLASLALMSLRLLGLAFARQTVPQVAYEPTRLLWIGLSLAVTSGVLMFLTGPKHYYYNEAFDLKMLLLLAAVSIQLVLFRLVTGRASPQPALARFTAVLSLALWFAVGAAGRAIGFT